MRTKLIIAHIVFWVLESARMYYYSYLDPVVRDTSFQYLLSCWAYIPFLFYLNYFVLFPKIVRFKKFWTFFFWGAVYTFLFFLGYVFWAWLYKGILLTIPDLPQSYHDWINLPNWSWRSFGYGAHEVAYFGAVSTLLRFYWDWYHNKLRSEKIKQKALESEIDLLEKLIDFPTLDEYLKTIQLSDFKAKKALILDLSAILRQNLYNEVLSSDQYKTLLQKIINLHNLSQDIQCKINFKNTKLNNEHFNEINNILRFNPSLIIISKAGVQYKS